MSATRAILKTELIQRNKGLDTVAVTAYSYSAEPRTDFVPVLGGDGRMHAVPVPWTEYLPLQKTTLITIKNIGYTETEYNSILKNLKDQKLPENATCYKGMLAHIGMGGDSFNEFIKQITK